jgi:rhamnosyltransferase
MVPVTVLLRTFNAGPYLGPLLDVLGRQTREPAEILVLDSDSTDDTAARSRAAGARVVRFDRSTFSHARSTNAGFREAKGEIVAMLSQDALPADETWLATLVAPLEGDPQVAGVFGRHHPRPGCFPLERWEVERAYPAAPPAGVVYSNVNSAARRADWEAVPFDEDVTIAEDRFWALAQEARGRRIVYAPAAGVLHSHEYTLAEVADRCRAEARERWRREGEREGWGLLLKGWPRQTLRDTGRLLREGRPGAVPRAALYRFAQFRGMIDGGRSA